MPVLQTLSMQQFNHTCLRVQLLIINIVLSLSLTAQDLQNFTINADLPNWDSCYITVLVEGVNVYEDSVRNGTFRYTGQVKGVKEGTLKIKKKNFTFALPLFVEAGVIEIKDTRINRLVFDVTGTKHNNIYDAFQKQIKFIHPSSYVPEEKQAEYNGFAMRYIEENRHSLVSLEIYRSIILPSQISDTLKISLFHSISKSLRKTYGGKQIQERLNYLANTSLGKKAPAFMVADTTGRLVSLKSFKEQYILLDFWASWCKPCREENPTVRKMYEKYKDKGFTVISVSLDTDKKLWKEAIQKDKLSWTNVSDLKPSSSVAKLYYVQAIPANYLLNRKGVIIDKNLVGSALEDKLQRIFQ
jgi:peroxiredoxin